MRSPPAIRLRTPRASRPVCVRSISRASPREAGWLVVLLSGGASALLAAPVPGVTLEDKVATGRALMRAGVAIDGLNCVRKHLSRIKGGRLAAAAARTITLAISDVHGPVADDPSVIGSGPTVGDPTTFAQALAIVQRADEVPPVVRRYLERGAAARWPRRSSRMTSGCRMAPTRSSAIARPRSTARRRPRGRLATPST